MKKIFLTRRNALLSPENLSWGVYALGAALALLTFRFIAPNAFWSVLAPVLSSAARASETSHQFLSSFGDRAMLALENEQLTKQNTVLEVENQMLEERLATTAALSSPRSRQVVARVLARPPVSAYDTLILDAGTDDGVAVGDAAFALASSASDQGVPVGYVSWASRDFSRVTLFSAPGIESPAWVGEKKNALMVLGQGGGAFTAVVPRDVTVSVGDPIYIGPLMQRVGTVLRIDSDPSSPSVVLQIAPLVNPFNMSDVALRDVGAAVMNP